MSDEQRTIHHDSMPHGYNGTRPPLVTAHWGGVTCRRCVHLHSLAPEQEPDLDPEDPYAHLNEAERLGLLVGASYGAALAERDEAQARVASLEDQVNTLAHAASRVLKLSLLENLTWANDERDVDALRQAVESVQATRTETKD